MRVRRRPRVVRAAGQDRVGDRQVLVAQLVADRGDRKHPRPVLQHVAAQKRRQRLHDLQQHQVVARLVDRGVKIGVGFCLLLRVGGDVGTLDPLGAGADAVQIHVVGAHRRHRRGRAFHRVAELQIMIRDLAPFSQQPDQRIGDRGCGKLRHPRAAPFLAGQKPPAFQVLQRQPHRRARHPQPQGQLALGQQRLAGSQRSFKDQPLNPRGDGGGGGGGLGRVRAGQRVVHAATFVAARALGKAPQARA